MLLRTSADSYQAPRMASGLRLKRCMVLVSIVMMNRLLVSIYDCMPLRAERVYYLISITAETQHQKKLSMPRLLSTAILDS